MNQRKVIESLSLNLALGRVSRREFVRQATVLGLSLVSIGQLLTSCRPRGKPFAAGADAALGPIEKELAVYNWSDYIAEDVVPNFEKEFGVKVSYETYESNEELLARLQAGTTGYDIIVPSGYVIPVLVARGLAYPIHREYLTNWNNLSPIFQNLATDPGNAHTVPWQWGTTGIAFRKDKVAAPPDSWAVFGDSTYHKRLTMMDDGREVIGAMLRYRGHSLNSVDPAELAEARADAIEDKKHLKAYLSAPVKRQLISGDVVIAQLWNGDTAQARREQPNLEYVLPREGGTIWGDNMVVLQSAPHKRAAHEFMNYVLRPEVGAAISNFTGYGSPNQAATPLLRTPMPYPTAEELGRLEFPVDLGKDTATWDRIWSEIRSA